MNEDERLINETWPIIRETVNRHRKDLELMGIVRHLERMPLRSQLDFWLGMKLADETRMPEVTEIARQVKGSYTAYGPF